MEELVSLCKRRGFVYPTSEIYGGLANSYDYGPLGVQLMKNIKDAWWKEFIEMRTDMVGLDSQIIQHPNTWIASGHVEAFSDPLVEDTVTKKRYRADHVIEAWINKHADFRQSNPEFILENLTLEQIGSFIEEHGIKSESGNQFTKPKQFNLLFESAIGTVSGEKSKVYLRGETAQGIFTNFKQVTDSSRVKLPFGIGNIGKSFRNEITTGQFIFRTLEFEQAEIEYFFDPDETNWQETMEMWKSAMWNFVTHTLGVKEQNLRWRRHADKERSHYSLDTYDLEYKFSFGWKELWGLAYRTDYDLKQHIKVSGKNLQYTYPQDGRKIIPHVIEPALGLNRTLLMILMDSLYHDEEKKRTVLSLKPSLAPNHIAIIPLVRNNMDMINKAKDLFFRCIKNGLRSDIDERGNIGKAYMYQDEIGTPFCITIDHTTLEDNTVTIRYRDTALQERISLDLVTTEISKKIFI